MKPKSKKPARFHTRNADYHADTCQPLHAAARAGHLQFAAAVHGSYPGTTIAPKLLPEICSVGSWDARSDQNWGLDWHRNEGIEFTYLFSGKLDFAVGDSTHRLRPGHLTITRPWQRHRVGNPHISASHLAWLILDVGVRRPNQHWSWPDWLMLTKAERNRLSTLLRQNEQPLWMAGPRLADLFGKIETVARNASTHLDRTRLILAINALLLLILEFLEGQRIPLSDSFTSNERCVELFLNELPALVGEPWTVDEMAARCGLKRSRFTTYCQQITNRTPNEYLLYCRVNAAARLLCSASGTSITDIAYATGFSSGQHFATAFRGHQKLTPTQYREKHSQKSPATSRSAKKT